MSFVAVVEDDEKIALNIVLRLREHGYGVVSFPTGEAACAWLTDPANVTPDMLLIDVRLPSMSGLDVLRKLGPTAPPTVVISGEASMTETVDAIRLGVFDFVDKPFTVARLLKSVQNCLDHAELRRQVSAYRSGEQQILGSSDEIRGLLATIERVASTNTRVLIRGESGSGKELVAAALHRLSRRKDGPFVTMNCAAIPHHLIEDELFGHVRGAFTDARQNKAGVFDQAHRGTLFLDEVGDMDLAVQSRLLRVLEDGLVRRIGDSADRAVDVRIITATHRDLEAMVAEGAFREDLYFRLAGTPIVVPPLRARRDDIAVLFTAFLQDFCRRNNRAPLTVDGDVFDRLRAYDWPGNVRELRNLAERMSIFGTAPLTVEQLPSSIAAAMPEKTGETGMIRLPAGADVVPLRSFKTQCEKEYIESVLQRTNWNVTRAAELLAVHRTHLHQKIVSLGIERPAMAPSTST
jgi:two-component system, NtrC family, nitrogen regulation response regulator NtrX